MQDLVQDLLVYSRVESASRPVEPVDCDQLMANVRESLAGLLAESGGTIRCAALPVVMGDSHQIFQLLQNLVNNGLKFSGEGVSPMVSVSAERTAEGWLFRVADNGIGIEPEHHERIFEMFRRLHPRAAYPGTGIGLALCRKIVNRHGGRIWVESEPGQGATFCFVLPVGPVGLV